MNAVNVGLVTFIIQHNRIQGVFLLCKITNLLIYSTKFEGDLEKSIPFQRKAFRNERLFFTQNEMSIKFMKKILKRLCTGGFAFCDCIY